MLKKQIICRKNSAKRHSIKGYRIRLVIVYLLLFVAMYKHIYLFIWGEILKHVAKQEEGISPN